MGRHEEEEEWLLKALEIEPDMESALLNLGGLQQDDGDIPKAVSYLTRAIYTAECLPYHCVLNPLLLYDNYLLNPLILY
jgi:tetratricopeptide (TPR) repeat protein